MTHHRCTHGGTAEEMCDLCEERSPEVVTVGDLIALLNRADPKLRVVVETPAEEWFHVDLECSGSEDGDDPVFFLSLTGESEEP